MIILIIEILFNNFNEFFYHIELKMKNNMAVTHDVRAKMKALNDLKNVDKEIEQKLKLRQKANKEILGIIENLVNDNSQLRFCQILTILGLDNDNFNEESVDTLARIKEKVASL